MPGILSCFENLTPTNGQRDVALAVEAFLNGSDSVFLLSGYAGTGKTTLLGGICRYVIEQQQREVRLMAPTGRAAKVLGDKTSGTATTIHRGIYNFHELESEEGTDAQGQLRDGFQFVYKLASDAEIVRQVFVIDEASMVSDKYAESEFFRFGTGFLLRDLLAFAKAGQPNVHTQLIFVGDPAQLPPFGMNHSPALSEAHFRDTYRLRVQSATLREVVRQGEQSGVLAVATRIREGLAAGYFNQFEIAGNGRDVHALPNGQFWDAYAGANANKIVIAWKNKTAKGINNRIRAERFGPDVPALMPGDLIILAQNNYQHAVTNGTFGMIQTMGAVETRTVLIRGERPVALRWQSVEVLVQADDAGGLRTIQANTLLNFLESDESKLTSAEMRGLFVDFTNRATKLGIKRRSPEFAEMLKVDPFFSALMLKHAYAITCHKAQGGEWKTVFTVWDKNTKEDFNPFTDEQSTSGRNTSDFFRWAYTAITRSSQQLYAINPPRLTPFSKMAWIDTGLATRFLATQGIDDQKLPWGNEQQDLMTRLGLANRELFVQHKIAAIAQVMAPAGLTIETVRSSQYLETVTVRGEADRVGINCWYSGKRKFTRHQKADGSDALFAKVEPLLQQADAITFDLPFAETTDQPGVAEPAQDLPATDKPFVTLLRHKLTEAATLTGIHLSSAKSLQYCERCQFERGSERAVLNFIYDGDGFFTEVRAMPKQCNSASLLAELRHLVQSFRA
ncbi:MAG: AAA family ATPase [Spirosoma sp.]|nr:AAA family ATPase [Spirosoma sp.]